MPIWLQLVTALSAGAVSALMGRALVPYLQKLRCYPPEVPKEGADTAAGEERRPIMGGLLLIAGMLFSMVLCVTLYLQFGGADRTSAAFAQQVDLLRAAGVYAAVLAVIGIVSDYLTIRGRYRPRIRRTVLLPLAAVAGVGAVILGRSEDVSRIALLAAALPAAAVVCLLLMHSADKNTDGTLLTVNTLEFLVLTVLLLKRSEQLLSVYTLAAAGACMGCMVWSLHPAKCRIGYTGSDLLGGIVPMVCVLEGLYRELALFMAVYVIQELYRLRRHSGKRLTLTEGLEAGGVAPFGRIAIMAGFAAFCGVTALLLH